MGESRLPEPRTSESGFPVRPVYGPDDVADGLDERLGTPGGYPFSRGVYPTMYTERPWTMRHGASGYGGYAVELHRDRE